MTSWLNKYTRLKKPSTLIAPFDGPVFGMVVEVHGLILTGASGAGRSPKALGLDFRSGPLEKPLSGIRIETRVPPLDRREADVELVLAASLTRWIQLARRGREKQIGKKIKVMRDYPQEVLIHQRLAVEGAGTAREVYRWHTPGIIHAMSIEGTGRSLLISTFGFDTFRAAGTVSARRPHR